MSEHTGKSQAFAVTAARVAALAAIAIACGSNAARESDGAPPPPESDSRPPTAPDAMPANPAFPADPIIAGSAPANAGELFGDPDSGSATGGPCLMEPEVGALIPRNWLRLRVRFEAPREQNLFEIRLESPNEAEALSVYTDEATWVMPASMWTQLSLTSADVPIEITVRGAAFDGAALTSAPARGSSGAFTIAPVGAAGTIVYWTTTGGSSLKGFGVGAATVRDVLTPAQASTGCIGCHSATPDGIYVGFSASDATGSGEPATFGLASSDGAARFPGFVSDAAATLLQRRYQQAPVFSPAHWSEGDRIGISMFEIDDRTEIIWTDLEAASTDRGIGWGVVARNGDPSSAAAADFAHGGELLVYASGGAVNSGVNLYGGDGDLYTVPYGARAGGDAAPLAGAATAEHNEYYPSFSPDDELVAFSRVPTLESSYDNELAEVFVVPTAGGEAVRLAANDPPACSDHLSPGVTNSWPKWAPEVAYRGDRAYYWLVFSSRRAALRNPQMYVTGLVVDELGISTHAAIYLWNQPELENNHTPAWDSFDID